VEKYHHKIYTKSKLSLNSRKYNIASFLQKMELN